MFLEKVYKSIWNFGLEKLLSARSSIWFANSCESLEDTNAERNVDYSSLAHEISVESKNLIRNWARDQSCDILLI